MNQPAPYPKQIDEVLAIIDRGRVPGAIESLISTAFADAASADKRHDSNTAIGPLDGLMFGIKSNIDVRGTPTTSGLLPSLAQPAVTDAVVVKKLKAQGAIATFTTSMAPLAIGAITESDVLGPCVNPRDSTLHAGGSSGGSGAVVGAGLVPFALGSDTMGSVRIPAAYCGVFGWLPTHGLVSARGMTPLAPSMDSVGVLAQDAHVLSHVAHTIIGIDDVFAWSREVDLAPLSHAPRLIATCDWGLQARDTEQQAVADLVQLMKSWGSTATTPVAFSDSVHRTPDQIRRHGLLVVEASASSVFSQQWQRELMSPAVLAMLEYAEKASATKLWQSINSLVNMRRSIRRALSGVDCLILPTTPESAPPIGTDPVHAADLTAWVNIAGLPAIAIPWQGTSVQLVGQPGSDLNLLEWAKRIDDSSQSPNTGGRRSMNADTPS